MEKRTRNTLENCLCYSSFARISEYHKFWFESIISSPLCDLPCPNLCHLTMTQGYGECMHLSPCAACMLLLQCPARPGLDQNMHVKPSASGPKRQTFLSVAGHVNAIVLDHTSTVSAVLCSCACRDQTSRTTRSAVET
jgi:hypothetical protein